MNYHPWIERYLAFAKPRPGDGRNAKRATRRAKSAIDLRKGEELSVFAQGCIDMCVAACGLMAQLDRHNQFMPKNLSDERNNRARQSLKRVDEDSSELMHSAQKAANGNDRMLNGVRTHNYVQRQVSMKTMAGRFYTACLVVGMLLDDYGDENGRKLYEFGETRIYKLERTHLDVFGDNPGAASEPWEDHMEEGKLKRHVVGGEYTDIRGHNDTKHRLDKYSIQRHGEQDSRSEN